MPTRKRLRESCWWSRPTERPRKGSGTAGNSAGLRPLAYLTLGYAASRLRLLWGGHAAGSEGAVLNVPAAGYTAP